MAYAVVGRGRLGRSLAELLTRAGRDVRLVGRGEVVPASAEVVLLCVPDGAVAEAARAVPRGPVVLHCAGALDVDVLRPHHPAGSIHPLMTFPGPEIALPDLAGVPAAVDGDPKAVEAAHDIAAALGLVPFHVPGDRRLYHAAAVLAGASGALLGEASRVLAAAGVDPTRAAALLAPLVHASVDNAVRFGSQARTGPASRGDSTTLDAHRAALEEHGLSDIRAIYDAVLARSGSTIPTGPRSPSDGT